MVREIFGTHVIKFFALKYNFLGYLLPIELTVNYFIVGKVSFHVKLYLTLRLLGPY